MREHVVAASKAMRNGDWKKAANYIINDKMNAKVLNRVVFNPFDPPLQVWDLFYDADSVRSMLTRKIQEESLRTYLFTYSNVYDSISIVSTGIRIRISFIFTPRNCQQLTSKFGSKGVKFMVTSLTTLIVRQLLTHTH